MDYKKQVFLKTLLYFDIFDYPLKIQEIWQFLEIKQTLENLHKSITNNPNIEFYKSFYFVKGKRLLIKKRLKREKISNQKLVRAIKIIKKMSIFPTINFIGISGALAMNNCDTDDDIDLFVICENNLVWITRLFLVIFLISLGVYRRKKDLRYKDKICLNLIVGKKNILFSKNKQTLYLAHEIAQLVPVFERNNFYYSFVKENNWIFNYLPNVKSRINSYEVTLKKNTNVIEKLLIKLLLILRIEKIAKVLQLAYMKNDITREEVRDNFLAFHPVNYEKQILEALFLRIKAFK